MLAVDFDGTLVANSWPSIGDWNPGAVAAMHRLLAVRARIVVHTCRIAPMELDGITARPIGEVHREINGIRELLDAAGLREVEIHTDPWKPSADAYVDDKAVPYLGRPKSWENLVPKLEAMLATRSTR